MITKECSKCKEVKELNKFYKREKTLDGREGLCKMCRREQRLTNPGFKENELRQNEKRKWNTARKEKMRWDTIRWKYGIDEVTYRKMEEEQNYKCLICGRGAEDGIQYGKLVVDHCHTTNNVRGLLCNRCNVMLGKAADDIQILEAGIKYLKERN